MLEIIGLTIACLWIFIAIVICVKGSEWFNRRWGKTPKFKKGDWIIAHALRLRPSGRVSRVYFYRSSWIYDVIFDDGQWSECREDWLSSNSEFQQKEEAKKLLGLK